MINTHQSLEEFIAFSKTLSPFELKDTLIQMAKSTEKLGAYTFLNAGRGNPNWTAASPREAFFALGQFAVCEAKAVCQDGALAGIPSHMGIAKRFKQYVALHAEVPGITLLKDIIDFGINYWHFEPDHWVYELVDGILGDHYPIPDRILRHTERVIQTYLIKEMGADNLAVAQDYDLFAVEGGTAAMCYIFDSLIANHLLSPHDAIAVMVPIFTPYLEIPELGRYQFDVTYIHADAINEMGRHTWQYSEKQLDQLRNPKLKALFVVNPSNPPSVAMDHKTLAYLKNLITSEHPELMIITDDVYGTFAEDFHSLLTEIPQNTIGVYSYSKYFGATGWRLGVIALHTCNIFDKRLQELPAQTQQLLEKRYHTLTRDILSFKFIDRMVADSRQVALNHTAGLSTPQQIQMLIFSAFALLDESDHYKTQTKEICLKRLHLLFDELEGLPLYIQPHSTSYYREIDLLTWAKLWRGQGFADYLKTHHEPEEILYYLARDYAIVLLNGNGFMGPDWSIRISLANLPDEAYQKIGQAIHTLFKKYENEWNTHK